MANACMTPLWLSIPIMEIIFGTAPRTSHRLRMKAPVGRIAVFSFAEFIQRPRLHRRIWPVVWQRQHYAVTRSTVRAVDVGIKIPAIAGIEEFLQTVFANGQVGRNANGRVLSVFALPNCKFVKSRRFDRDNLQIGDAGRRRRVCSQVTLKLLQGRRFAFEMDFDPFASVEYPSRQGVIACQPINKGTEPYALHNPPHSNQASLRHGYRSRVSRLQRLTCSLLAQRNRGLA